MVYLLFVDFKRASDSISRNKIFEITNYFGILTKLVKLVSVTSGRRKSMCSGTE